MVMLLVGPVKLYPMAMSSLNPENWVYIKARPKTKVPISKATLLEYCVLISIFLEAKSKMLLTTMIIVLRVNDSGN